MEQWKHIFAEGIRIAWEKDYLSDIIYENCEDTDEAYEIREKEMKDAFEAIFNEKLNNW